MNRTGILIIGGGAIGSAAALFLRRAQGVAKGASSAPGVTVIEPDPSYALASTPRATGGVRRLFSLPENIQMSQASLDFFMRWHDEVNVNGEAPDPGWKPGGYLFVVDDRAAKILERNAATQRRLGVAVELLDRHALQQRYPAMRCDDLTLAALSPGDGWLDPNAVLQGLKKKAQHLGAHYVQDRVTAIQCESKHGSKRVTSATLASGAVIHADVIINAAGAWAAEVCAMIGMPLPVSPMRRF